jgi:crossover junction endodeoxyribonuclease RuvC
MVIIGLDLSLTAPGWFRWDSSDLSIQYGTWQQKSNGLDRMHAICRNVLRLVPTVFDPGSVTVIIEGFSFGSKGAALYEIGGLGYIVRYALWCRKVKVIEAAPSAVKKFATGKGNVNKNIVIRDVFKRWSINVEDDNAADAFVLGKIGLCLAGIEQPETEFQRDVLKTLQKQMPKVTA